MHIHENNHTENSRNQSACNMRVERVELRSIGGHGVKYIIKLYTSTYPLGHCIVQLYNRPLLECAAIQLVIKYRCSAREKCSSYYIGISDMRICISHDKSRAVSQDTEGHMGSQFCASELGNWI